MKFTTKLLAAAFALTAASAAFASDDDGQADNTWLQQTAVSQQAPAPVAAASGAFKATEFNSDAVTP